MRRAAGPAKIVALDLERVGSACTFRVAQEDETLAQKGQPRPRGVAKARACRCPGPMLGLNPEQLLGIGLTLQTASCLSAAFGLAFMKRSTELEGDRIIVYRFWWWVGFLLLGI